MFLKNKSEVIRVLIEHIPEGKLIHQEEFEEILRKNGCVPSTEMSALDRNNHRYRIREELFKQGYDLISPLGYKNYVLLCSLPKSFVMDKYPVKLSNMGNRQGELLEQKMRAMRQLIPPGEKLQKFDNHVARFGVVAEMLDTTMQQLETEKLNLDIFVLDLITGPDKDEE